MKALNFIWFPIKGTLKHWRLPIECTYLYCLYLKIKFLVSLIRGKTWFYVYWSKDVSFKNEKKIDLGNCLLPDTINYCYIFVFIWSSNNPCSKVSLNFWLYLFLSVSSMFEFIRLCWGLKSYFYAFIEKRSFRPFICFWCDRRFPTYHQLKGHVGSHLRLPTCELCGNTFTRKSSLAVHMMSHTGDRPHKCQKCGKCFITKSALNK